jgi:hypothetical protein
MGEREVRAARIELATFWRIWIRRAIPVSDLDRASMDTQLRSPGCDF